MKMVIVIMIVMIKMMIIRTMIVVSVIAITVMLMMTKMNIGHQVFLLSSIRSSERFARQLSNCYCAAAVQLLCWLKFEYFAPLQHERCPTLIR